MSKREEGAEVGEAAVAAYLLDARRRNLSPRTIDDRRRLFKRFPHPLVDVQREQIEDWLDSCVLGPRSRYTYISYFAAFFQFAVENGYRPDDPTVRIRRPKLGRLLPRPISDEDLGFALSVADLRMRAWLCLAAYQGFRCAEIAALRREDLHLGRVPPLIIVRQGKGAKDGILPLNPLVEDALRAYGLRPGFLFLLNDGRPFSPRTLSSYGTRFLHGIGIEGGLHRCRHSFGTAVYALSGGDLFVTQEMLRHADPSSTAIYTAWDQVKAAEVVQQLGAHRRAQTIGGT